MSKILIIEDEMAIAELEKDYLALSDFQVEVCNSGDAGLVKALAEEFDLVITTPSHAQYLESMLATSKKLIQVALRPSAHFFSSIIKISKGKRLGCVVYSERFGSLIYQTYKTYTEDVRLSEPFIVSSFNQKSVSEYLASLDAVIVPKHYEKFFSSAVSDAVRTFNGDVIETYYELDEGSMLYLERKIKNLFDKKNI